MVKLRGAHTVNNNKPNVSNDRPTDRGPQCRRGRGWRREEQVKPMQQTTNEKETRTDLRREAYGGCWCGERQRNDKQKGQTTNAVDAEG